LNPEEGERPVQVLWLGGCYNPPGELYYACFPQFAQLFANLGPAAGFCQEDVPICFGKEFSFKLDAHMIDSRPKPETGPWYGVSYVFFFACAGFIDIVDDPGGAAGSFPIACFDSSDKATRRRLSADSFVPGYLPVYAFEDQRTNTNPIVSDLTLDGEPVADEFIVERCPSTEEERRAVGCFAGAPYAGCKGYEIDVDVPEDIAEEDPDATLSDGTQIFEAVWVSYLVDGGDLTEGGVRLISGTTEGYKDDHKAIWMPPSEPGLYTIWAVVRDTRGGSTAVRREVRVE
jgi:hypothetical protein